VTVYSFDTSSILNGRRDLLPPLVFKTLWANVESMIAEGRIRCIDVVSFELGRRDDEACTWAKTQDGLFVPLNEAIQLKTREVLGVHPKLTGIGGGRNQADPFVIALAMTYPDGVVVTEETLTGNIVKPRIPDVCNAMNIRWLNLIGFVTEQGWSF
jgi:hypothetical protein